MNMQTANVSEDSIFDDMPILAFPSDDSADGDYYVGIPTIRSNSFESFEQQLLRWSKHHIFLQILRSPIIFSGHTHEEIDARFSILFQIDGGSENSSPCLFTLIEESIMRQ